MTRAACVLLFLAPALLADDKKPDAKTETAAIKGKWKVTATKYNGKDVPLADGRVLVFDEKEFTAFEGAKKGRTLGFTLDPTTEPKRLDLTLPGSDQKVAGIYILDGDSLKLCYGEPGTERPKKLESKADEKVFLLVLERVKPQRP